MSDLAFQPRPMTAAPDENEVFAMRPGIARVRRNHMTILVQPDDGRSMRISPVGAELVPLLAQGATLHELESHLRRRFPAASDVNFKLRQFLGQLVTAGFLGHAEATPIRRTTHRLVLFNPDPVARAIAAVLLGLPSFLRGLLLGVLLGAAGVALTALVLSPALPHPREIVTRFSWGGLAFLLLVLLPIHELAHAVAARMAGIPVTSAGLLIHGLTPGPFVDTSGAYRVTDRRKRFWIPAVGPLVDLLCCALAAGLLVFGPDWGLDPRVTSALPFVFLGSALLLTLNLNPIMPSDGSHMIEALRDDELLRRSALSRRGAKMSRPMDVALYRALASMFWQGLAVLLWFWWFHAA
ncbi:site-2 protease family protein [Paracoccus aminophilus]|uniref:Peptidase M50 domain-containing protein n=1 Tax=Paracoccus aminophilus JCM 7686 TaxID=1367847 RepID=S5YHK4_PARAH|nr:site-2 protease family protein [Paracoccus aminophilus]AGT10943.1 hypothetical protein JCM7686_pAMI4p253 [Paracoccus aminophilus JCM 7686]